MSTPSDAPQPDEPQRYFGMTKRAHIVTGIVFAVVFLSCLGAIQGWWGASDPEPPSVIDQAQNACYSAVLDELKSPSSADLVDISAYPEEDEHWIVNGSVDAQNSFGAMVRNGFSCDVYQLEGQWHIASIDVN